MFINICGARIIAMKMLTGDTAKVCAGHFWSFFEPPRDGTADFFGSDIRFAFVATFTE